MPGAVWAIDGTWFDRPVGDRGRRALVVVDLHGKQPLAVESVPGERSWSVIACLSRLIQRHGAPLVLKADNGSAFIAAALRALCATHGITLLHSPVRRPSYNGTCEVSGRWAKRRAERAAQERGCPDRLCQADLDAAVTCRDPLPPVAAELRARFRGAVRQQLEVVARERGLALNGPLRDHVRRSLERVAVRRALELCHILTITGRAYQQGLPCSAA